MLSLFALMRFALSRSPLREQRELLFATTDPNDPKKRPEEQKQTEATKQPEERTPVQEKTQQTHAEVQNILQNLDTQQMFEELKGHAGEAELFDRIFEQEETLANVDIAGAAQTAGIAVKVAPKTPPQELLKQILDLDSANGIPPDKKRVFILTLIEQNPRMTAALSHGLLNRLALFEEQQHILDMSDKQLGKEGLAEAVKAAQGLESLDDALKAWKKKSRSAHLSNLLHRPRTVLKNAVKAIQITEGFGARFWGGSEHASPVEDDRSRRAYLESLRQEVARLSSLFCAQMRRESERIALEMEKHAGAIMRKKATGSPLTVADDLVLQSAGSVIERLHSKIEQRLPSPEKLPSITDPNFTEQCTETLRTFNEITTSIENIRRDADALSNRFEQDGTKEEDQEAKETRTWAERCRRMLALLVGGDGDPSLSGDTREHLRKLMIILMSDDALPAFAQEKREFYEAWLTRLLHSGERGIREMEARAKMIESGVNAQIDAQGIDVWMAEQGNRVGEEEQKLVAVLQHPICAEFSVSDQVHGLADDLRAKLHILKNKRIREQERRELCARIGVFVDAMRDARERIGALEQFGEDEDALRANGVLEVLPVAAYKKRFGDVRHSKACYYGGKLYLRDDVPVAERKETIRHERGHLILAILTEQSMLLPELMNDRMEQMEDESFAALETCGERWGITRERVAKAYAAQLKHLPFGLRQRRLDALYRRELLEEGLMRKAMTGESSASLHPDDQRAFASLEGNTEEDAMARHLTDDNFTLSDEQGGEGNKEQGGDTNQDVYIPDEDMEAIERDISGIRSFGRAYPQFGAKTRDILDAPDGYEAWMAFFKKLYNNTSAQAPDGTTRRMEDPTRNKEYPAWIHAFKKQVGNTNDECSKIDEALSDVNTAKKKKKGTLSQRLGIQWLCVLDIIRIYKEFKEDVEGIWKSKQDHITAEAKAALTKNLPSKIFGVKIPILGKYTERLPHYAERRKNQLELDRVKKWEDAFKNLDADSLVELIGANPTQDQLRASIQLLVEKGRMNWGDERVWKALNKFSKYQMPIAPCKRSEAMRDKWLHKLISDIWGDKDMYDDWMTNNEGNYDKHKKSYTHAADNLSNVAGKMAHELRTILQLFVEHTDPHTGQLKEGHILPEEVNPHHYEELLHYAMRMGKMSMEQKMFFLIQGIRYHLLPINRLRVLAGERGELLMKFPFLDYFYQRHNSYEEICHLGEKIEEGPDNKFEPGLKTTIFMRLILLRDSKARERMSKAISKASEGLDHEDIPYLATEFDWSRIQNLFNTYSGTRSKVSVEGCKNAYVGFSEKLKMYAHLARLAKKGEATFTVADTRDIATSLAAFVFFDNQMMQVFDVGNRVKLTETSLSEFTVANSACTTAQFRDPTRNLVADLTEGIGMRDEDLQMEGGKLSEFVPSAERDRGNPISPDKGKKYETIAMKSFAKVFVDRLTQNPDLLINLLIKYENAFLDSTTDTSGESKLTYQNFAGRYQGLFAGHGAH